ncbi:MAG: molybdopterin-dependent oxidoreductase, partial [Deltaproteobacteria bacterium]|nr:molybdopterin-dependent oxidoreductase [Deltaproteobacteria bacterium]
MQAVSITRSPQEEAWLPTLCDGCFTECGVLVRVEGGVVTAVRGNPAAPQTRGKMCAKGKSRIMTLYNPRRVTTPLRRTNPEKGLGVDPGWQPISWDEALSIVADRLRRVREDDPRKLIFSTFDHGGMPLASAWGTAFGSPNLQWIGYYCGNALHPVAYLTNGTFHSEVDFDYCEYLLEFGSQQGFMVGVNANIMTQKMAEARKRGMRLVVIDPVCTNAAAKSTEWVPIRPGDAPFLRAHTNAPYLTGTDGSYVRDPESGKPLVWDETTECARPFDAAPATGAVDGGPYLVGGRQVWPAFERLRQHARFYTAERVADITTIPAETIRRLAREFATAARIGSTIMLEGRTLPFRPAAAHFYRGAEAHKHGTLAMLAVQLLNLIVGSQYVPGSHHGENIFGPWWAPEVSADGLIIVPHELTHGGRPYPPRQPKAPDTLGLNGLFPLASNWSPAVHLSVRDPGAFKLPYRPEVLINSRKNLLATSTSPAEMAEDLKKIPFIVCFSFELNETAELADIVLPDTHEFERTDVFSTRPYINISPATGYFYWGVRQPVVSPPGECRSWFEVLFDLADRAGFREEFNAVLNAALALEPPWQLEGDKPYRWPEVAERWLHARFGPEHGLDWFREHGLIVFPRTLQDLYPLPWLQARFPVYFEFFLSLGREVQKVADEIGVPWDTADYQAVPDWKPCAAFEPEDGYDLFVVNFKVPFHTLTATQGNPWLDEVSQRHPFADKVLLNSAVAARKGLKSGDLVWVESRAGRLKGELRVTECIHPEVIGTSGIFGCWARDRHDR